MEAELFENAQQQGTVADDRFQLLPQFHHRRLNRTLEGEQCLARFHAHAQGAPTSAQGIILGRVEEAILLQPARADGRGPCP